MAQTPSEPRNLGETTSGTVTVHGTTVGFKDRGVLVIGPSGSGKSGLALQLLALGADLVADDYSVLQRNDSNVISSCPTALRGKIEARNVGILNSPFVEQVRLHLVIDLQHSEVERLPPMRDIIVLGLSLPLLHNVARPYFPAAIVHYLDFGRNA